MHSPLFTNRPQSACAADSPEAPARTAARFQFQLTPAILHRHTSSPAACHPLEESVSRSDPKSERGLSYPSSPDRLEAVGCELPTNKETPTPPAAARFLGVPTVARTPEREELQVLCSARGTGEFIAAVSWGGRTDGWVASKHQRAAARTDSSTRPEASTFSSGCGPHPGRATTSQPPNCIRLCKAKQLFLRSRSTGEVIVFR